MSSHFTNLAAPKLINIDYVKFGIILMFFYLKALKLLLMEVFPTSYISQSSYLFYSSNFQTVMSKSGASNLFLYRNITNWYCLKVTLFLFYKILILFQHCVWKFEF